jgi:hypothetical protein
MRFTDVNGFAWLFAGLIGLFIGLTGLLVDDARLYGYVGIHTYHDVYVPILSPINQKKRALPFKTGNLYVI